MMQPDIHIPVDQIYSLSAEHHDLSQKIAANNKENRKLKNYVGRLINAAKKNPMRTDEAQIVNTECASTTSSNTTLQKTVKSVDSITSLGSEGELEMPSIEDFVAMSAQGKLDISDTFLKELHYCNTRIDVINEVGLALQNRWSEIDTSIKNIIKEVNGLKQYFKIDNLSFHKFRLPYSNLSSLETCIHIARQINILLPHLPVPVTAQHISTAHPLPTKSKKSDVFVVRFCNRHIKDMIYSARNLVLSHGVSITEHLADHTKVIVKEAEELFGSENVGTEHCKVYVFCDGRSNRVTSTEEVHALFVKFCETIGSDKNYVFKPMSPSFCNSSPVSMPNLVSSYKNIPLNNHNFANQSHSESQTRSFRVKSNGRKRFGSRKPYYVRERQY